MTNRPVVIAVLVALLATAGWWFGLYSPKNDQLAAVEVEIDDLLSRQQQLRNEITQLRQVQADEEDIRAALDRLIDYIPQEVSEPEAVRQLQASADSAGVTIESVTFGEPAPLAEAPAGADPAVGLAEIPVTMVLKGTYFEVVDFLRRLEVDGQRAILITSVSMAEGEDGFPELTTTWAGKMFAEVPVVVPEAPARDAADDDAGDASGSGTDASATTGTAQAMGVQAMGVQAMGVQAMGVQR